MNRNDPLAPFVIGITGNMDPAGYLDSDGSIDPQGIKKIVENILDWIFFPSDPGGELDPTNGTFVKYDRYDPDRPITCWTGLAKSNTPVIVLSSLAPGVDTLVAEAVLDYQGEPLSPPFPWRSGPPLRSLQ